MEMTWSILKVKTQHPRASSSDWLSK